jgi:hypothetical protein
MHKSRNTIAGVGLLAGLAICASFADLTAARAQDNNAASLPQVNVTAPAPQAAARPQSAPHHLGGGGTAEWNQLPPNQLVNVGVFRNVPADSARPIGQPVTSTDCRQSVRPGHPYFVEFRARTAATYGHAFVFYGKLTPEGQFAWVEVAGLHPAGLNAAVYLMGHVLPVASETGASWGDLDEQFMTARFCVTLTEQEFSRMVAYIKQRQATTPIWNAMTLNCTGFTGDVARFIGMQAPLNHLQVPEDYINEMHRLNASPAQYSAYQAEMRKVNSIPVPAVPAHMLLTVVGNAPAHSAAAVVPAHSAAASHRAVPPATQAVAAAPLPLPAGSW